MDKKRRMGRTNPAFVVLILILIGMVWYFDQFVIEELPVAQVPTPTATPIPEVLEFEADNLLEQGSLFPAIEMYKQAIIANPSDSNLHVKLAHAQILAGEYEAAVTSAQNALLLNDENPKALAELGWTLTFLGDPFGAEEALEQALSLTPTASRPMPIMLNCSLTMGSMKMRPPTHAGRLNWTVPPWLLYGLVDMCFITPETTRKLFWSSRVQLS